MKTIPFTNGIYTPIAYIWEYPGGGGGQEDTGRKLELETLRENVPERTNLTAVTGHLMERMQPIPRDSNDNGVVPMLVHHDRRLILTT